MRTTLFLVTLLLLTFNSKSFGHQHCHQVFHISDEVIEFSQHFDDWLQIIEEQGFFSNFGYKRQKEISKLSHEFSHIKSQIREKGKQNPRIKEIIEIWSAFSAHWIEQAKIFKNLSAQDKKRFKSTMELAASLSTKHLIAFLEAKNYKKWKLNRLQEILTSHSLHETKDLEAQLFLLKRQVEKSYSAWDSINCIY